MPLKVTSRNVQRGPFNKLIFTIENSFENFENEYDEKQKFFCDFFTKKITIDDMAEVHLRFEQRLPPQFHPRYETPVPIFVFLTTRKHPLVNKDLTIKLNVNCEQLSYSEQLTCTEKWLENINIGEKPCDFKGGYLYMLKDLEIDLSVKKVETVNFKRLYDDTVLTDFHLSTAEGSVVVHKVCLAAHSDVFKTMFSGAWKETKDGRIEIQGVTLKSLQHLKDFVYLGTLPDEGLCPLLLLASYYFMETLKTECIQKLVETVKSENLYSLLEFACENNIPELTFAILLQTPDDIVNGTYQMKKEKQSCKRGNVEEFVTLWD